MTRYLEIDPENSFAKEYKHVITGAKNPDKASKANDYNNKGLDYYNVKNYEKSLEWFDKALEIDPTFTYALHNKGLALSELKRDEEAIKWYDKALEIDPTFAKALYNKGLALSGLNRNQEALEWFDKALEELILVINMH